MSIPVGVLIIMSALSRTPEVLSLNYIMPGDLSAPFVRHLCALKRIPEWPSLKIYEGNP